MRQAEQIEASQLHVRKIGRIAAILFTTLLVVSILLIAICAWALVSQASYINQIGIVFFEDGGSIHLLFMVLWAVIVFLLTSIPRGIAVDISRGISPFTVEHARRICVLGVVEVLNALALMVMPFQTMPSGFVNIGLGPFLSFFMMPHSLVISIDGLQLQIDVGSLIIALMCFSISALWRYGALLQEQTNDLV